VDGTGIEGRLEVWAFNDWRAVCPRGFDDIDASVACVVLGFGYVCTCATIAMINENINRLQHLIRTTAAKSQNLNSKYHKR